MRDPQSPYRTAHIPDLIYIDTVTVLPNGARFTTGDNGLWWFGRISASTTTDGIYLVRVFDDPRLIMLLLSPARYTTSTRALLDFYCLQLHLANAFAGGIQRNVDGLRGATVDS